MAIQPDEWLQGPRELMSPGAMLEAAGYTVDRDKWVPPPPNAPIPINHVEPHPVTQPLAG
eukprot:7375586-Karenia_brevis.AAC.1